MFLRRGIGKILVILLEERNLLVLLRIINYKITFLD
jgi:hypothetical protein